MAYCTNEACRTELAACESTVRCQQCLGAEYCGEACRAADWVKHKCPNALLGATANDTHVLPYAWEDELTPEALAEEIGDNKTHPFLQAHSVTHYTGDGRVLHSFLPALVGVDAEGGVKRERAWGSYKRGVNPIDKKSSSALDGTYALSVDQLDRDDMVIRTFSVTGRISRDSIYSENGLDRVQRLLGELGEADESKLNRARRAARNFFSSGSKEGDRLILWPDLSGGPNRDSARKTPFDTRGTLRVTLTCTTGKSMATIFMLRGPYDFGKGEWFFKMARAATKSGMLRLRSKFPGDDSVKTMSPWRMEAQGTRLTFIIQQVGDKVFFRDFEFAISPQLMLEKLPGLALDSTAQLSEREQELFGTASASAPPPPPDYDYDASMTTNSEIHVGVDAGSLDQVTGLVMAMEHRGLTQKDLEPLGAILRPYARELCDKRNGYIHYNDIPDDVHTAIGLALERLTQNKRTPA